MLDFFTDAGCYFQSTHVCIAPERSLWELLDPHPPSTTWRFVLLGFQIAAAVNWIATANWKKSSYKLAEKTTHLPDVFFPDSENTLAKNSFFDFGHKMVWSTSSFNPIKHSCSQQFSGNRHPPIVPSTLPK